MIKYLTLKNHKALNSVNLNNLGHINIICGKNNSGKTTLLEAMCDEKKIGIGKELVGPTDWLLSLFKPMANRYTRPAPSISMKWFHDFINNEIACGKIWFSDKREEIDKQIKESIGNHNPPNSFGPNTFKFDNIFNTFFQKNIDFFKPILIPPKRKLDFKTDIILNQEVTPAGQGLLNKLFFLKNQDLESYKTYKTYKKIYETFEYITNSKFNVVPNTDNMIELFYKSDTNWINAEACGLGLTDVLIIVTVLNVFENKVVLIEEPENHLHADFQKRLLFYLTSIKFKQFFISTHSSIFLNIDIIDKIFYCQNNAEITITDQTTKSEIFNALGYSITENIVADILILLEGPTDIPVVKEMLKWVDIGSHHNIKYWPLGGDIMASLDLSVFAERNNVFALIDSDPGSKSQRTRFARNCKKNQIYCKKLNKYSIENYFNLEVLRKIFPQQIPKKVKKLLPLESVDAQIGFKKKNKTIKSRNYQIVKEMELEDIKGTDLEIFLLDIKKYLLNI
ncbi:ATP-dependent nuclease [Desulfobacula sp.]|uniref:ATP-dependent nuclease n=1 Tax=Desulfobacula sp. TaxID=2593537 RepID=UPI0027146E19|nr:AAA family ATPase [Desulfobacula sp.]